MHDGSTILVKSQIKHKIKDYIILDILQVTIETSTGPVNIATTYLSIPDFYQLASNTAPTYIIGDLSAKHRILEDNYTITQSVKEFKY